MSLAAGRQLYSFDTSALIDGLERFYPIKNFPGIWEGIDSLIDDGRLLVSEEAWREAVSADAPLKEWCEDTAAGRDRCICSTDDVVATTAGEIVFQFPGWVTRGKKNTADPFVIAVAEAHTCGVISGETNGGPGRPKIPYVCAQRGVPHHRFVDVIVAEGWVLHR
ncbi:MAG: DUF4411 family protein [Micrococcales bacterium]|nr:DUF4411 family protein [Micrococcales bacterium]